MAENKRFLPLSGDKGLNIGSSGRCGVEIDGVYFFFLKNVVGGFCCLRT